MLNVKEVRGLMVDLEGAELLELTERHRHRGKGCCGKGCRGKGCRGKGREVSERETGGGT